MNAEKPIGYRVDQNGLPDKFPTHGHDALFWESLGRTVATFGFLEEILGKAIFSFTATRPYEEAEINKAYAEWESKLEHALTDPLGNLIKTYGEAVQDYPGEVVPDFDELLCDLREAAKLRNVLCHGSWGPPDKNGASIPFFMNCQSAFKFCHLSALKSFHMV